MSATWPMVALREVLTHRKEFIEVDDETVYKRCRVQFHAQGIVLRDAVPGAEVKTKQQQTCRAGEFLVAEIDAKVGGFGIVPESLDGAIVSSHYFLFVVNDSVVDKQFLSYFVRTPAFLDQVAAQGSTNYAAIRPRDVMGYLMPLPALSEQRRIVAWVEELASLIEEARRLRSAAMEEGAKSLLSARDALLEPQSHWALARVGEFCDNPQYGYTASATYEPEGPRLLRITDIQNGRVGWDKVPFCRCPDPEKYLLSDNDVVVARTGATTGKSFLIRDCPEAVFASYLIRLRVKHSVSAEYLYHYFQTTSYWSQIAEQKTGTGQPNVNGRKLANITVAFPSLPEQRRIVAYLDELQAKVDALKRWQAQTAAEIDALLPAVLDRAFQGEL